MLSYHPETDVLNIVLYKMFSNGVNTCCVLKGCMLKYTGKAVLCFFNPMSYCQGVLRDTSGAFTAEMKDLARALYLYNEAANVYFKEN